MHGAVQDTPRTQGKWSVICKWISMQGWFFRTFLEALMSKERSFSSTAATCTTHFFSVLSLACHKSGCHGRSMTSTPPVPETSNMKLHILSRAVDDNFPHQH